MDLKYQILVNDMDPSTMLDGLEIDDKWIVVKKFDKKSGTGGSFSTGYVVRSKADGREYFLKAMDYEVAYQQPTPGLIGQKLYELTQANDFEKLVCARCKNQSLRKVVHAIDSGSFWLDPGDKHSVVEYLVFELAEGDIRAHLDARAMFDTAFALHNLHHIAVAIQELHRIDIAHQDLKPSNVLVFASTEVSKVADLGRAWSRDFKSPYDCWPITGDRTYAPPELRYNAIPADETTRRFGCDLYQLGSLAVFIFIRNHVNGLLYKNLDHSHWPGRWRGTFDDVLPFIQEAFSKSLDEFGGAIKNPELKASLTKVVRELCDPDPKHRGHPMNRLKGDHQHWLGRYITIFNHLAFRARTDLINWN